jgi:capsule polysaccharide export protein KpsE/RkpR
MNAPPKTELKLPPSAVELRRRRARKLAIRFALGVGIPTLIAIVYCGFIASPRYDSEAVVAVESNQDRTDSGRVTDADKAYQRDVRMLRDFIRSREVMARIDLDHYRSGDVDWWSRLGDDDLDYYRDMVDVGVEHGSNVLHLRVRAFAADKAKAFAETIVAAAEQWIVEESDRARQHLIAPAEAEVARCKQLLIEARSRCIAPGCDPAHDLDHQLAQKQLDEAIEALQTARLEAASVTRRLVVIAPASLPTSASGPKVAWDVATVFVTAAVLVAVLSLLGAAIREHANF